MKKGQAVPRVDEFAFVLLAGIVLMLILTIVWTTPTEPIPIVEPVSVDLKMGKGASSSFKVNISGTVLTNVTLSSSGAIANWLSFNKNDFNVAGSTLVTVTVKVPKTASEGLHTGNIKIKSTGGERTVSVNVEVSKELISEFSTSSTILGDFSVSYSIGSEILDSKKNVEITQGYFSGNEINLLGKLSESKLDTVTEGSIKLVVGDTNSAGNLIILLNNEEVFNRKVSYGEIDIPIDKSKIKTSNTITVKAGSPGWMFWTSTVYRINSVEFLIDYEGIYSKDITFSLDQEQVDNFDHFHLSYRVPTGGYSIPLPEMIIDINDQIVYWKKPPLTLFNETFEKDILGNLLVLNEGENSISFSFEENAQYEIRNAVLTVYYSG